LLLTSTNAAVQTCRAEPPVDPTPTGAPQSDSDLEQFLRENNNALVSYVYSWVRSRPDALDIVQEAYCRIFRLGDLRAVGHLRGYLFKTARNIATDWVRQRIVRDAFVQEEPLRGNRESASPEEIWLAREELEALQYNVEALPPKCKLALVMVRLDGASYEEVGECLGIKTHSARRLVERAMEYLLKPESQQKLARRARRTAAQEALQSEEIGALAGGQLATS
jgi:RNA polymerase sigma factor (sigma-70 family)